MIRTYHIGGDAFSEIIRDKDGVLMNLKPLDPAVVKIIVNRKGIIKRYEVMGKSSGKPTKRIEPEDMFHLARNRVADEIHGTGIVQVLEKTILRINEARSDWKRVLHWNVDPLFIYHMDTDDTTEIAAYKAKMDKLRGTGESIYVPKGVIVPELLSVAGNANLNPLPWIESETDRFYEASGVPKIIVGGVGGITEAAVKIAYLAFQQTIEEEQLFVEENVLSQLNLEINLEFPASLENELLSDKTKDGEEQAAKPNDTTAEMEGRK